MQTDGEITPRRRHPIPRRNPRADTFGPRPSRWISFTIGDADVASIVEFRDIDVVFVLVGVDDPIGRKACAAAVRVVNHDDILDPE